MGETLKNRELWIMGIDCCAGRGKFLCAYLAEAGYKARTAKIEELADSKPQGILLDISPFSCLLYTSPSPRDRQKSRMPSSA